ncbi:MAG: phytoene/squalene synthase family protein [Alphaproteobacteria bacterium]
MDTNSTQSRSRGGEDIALSACADTARELDRERWLASGLAPRRGRDDLAVLLAFNAEVARTRDVVSEPILGRIRLQWWRDTIEAAGAAPGIVPGDPAVAAVLSHPVADGLARLFAQGALAPADLLPLVDAREAELDDTGPGDIDSFLAHIDATAGTLNRAALRVLGVDTDAAREAADHAARAYGIAGQMRATAVNAARGPVTLPHDLLDRYGVTESALRVGKPPAGLASVARTLAERAHRHADAARQLRRDVPATALPVLVTVRFARGHLARLARADFDLFSPRLEPTPAATPLAVLATMLTGRY